MKHTRKTLLKPVTGLASLLLACQLAACQSASLAPAQVAEKSLIQGSGREVKDIRGFSIKSISSGVEFPVNTITTNTQTQAQVAMNKSGNGFIVTWATNHEADGFYNVYARRFGVDLLTDIIDDTVDASEFKINDDAGAKNYTNPTVAIKPTNNKFAVAWENHQASGIQVKAFDFGTAAQIGSQLTASATSFLYRNPDITFNDNYFGLVWQQSRALSGTLNYDIFGRIGQVTDTLTPTFSFPAAATRVHADSMTAIEETLPAVTTRNATGGNNSDFTATWLKSNAIVEVNRGFNSSGTPTTVTTASNLPEIASPYNSTKDLIAWPNNGTTDIYAKHYDGSSTYASSAINTTTTGTQDYPAVAMNDNYMVIVWHGPNSTGDTSLEGVYARFYDVSAGSFGTPRLLGEFLVNDTTTNSQSTPSVAMDENGNFVVVWYDSSSGSVEVTGKRYAVSSIPYP